ncbi:MAG: exo-alpha-sialidase [Clostridia bacterium]|nr:exo-alpha-sialidase [Clostridia bacterium]
MKKTVISCLLILTIISGMLPAMASTAVSLPEYQMYWGDWSINYSTDIRKYGATSIAEDYPQLINEVTVNKNNVLEFGLKSKVAGFYEAMKTLDNPGENFDYVFKARINSFGGDFGASLYAGPYRTILNFPNGQTLSYLEGYDSDETGVQKGYVQVSVNIGNDWHVWKAQKRGNKMTLFMDGIELASYFLATNGSNRNKIQFYDTTSETVFPQFDVAYAYVQDWSNWSLRYSTDLSKYSAEPIATAHPELINEIVVNEDTNNLEFNMPSRVKGYYEARLDIQPKENFDYIFKCKVNEHFSNFGSTIYMGPYRAFFLFQSPTRFGYLEGYDSDEIGVQKEYRGVDADIGYDWHVWKGEKRGNRMTVYMDGVELVSYYLPTNGGSRKEIHLTGTATNTSMPCMDIEYAYLINYNMDMEIISPEPEAEYEEGQDIVLQTQPTNAPDYVDYYINGVWVGKGLKAQSYKYTLKNPRCGTYIVSAVASDGEGSPSHVIYVRKTRTAAISCDGTVEYGKSLPVNISVSGVTNVSRVEYYAGGQLVAQSTSAPFDAAVSGLKVGSSVISARVYDENGSYFNSNSVVINVNAGSSSDFNIEQEYDLKYTYSGGAGSVELDDGYFLLSLNHSATEVSYLDENREIKTYPTGNADYRIVVTAGIAEVYRDGQLSFNFRMPRSDDGESSFYYTDISDVELDSSRVKAEAYRVDINGETELNAENLVFDNYYSLEFDKTDSSNESILLYDGQYEISLKLDRNGITAKAQPDRGGEIKEYVIADTVEPGYYRVTVYHGMAQMFRNNIFIGSFRAPVTYHKKAFRRIMSSSGKTTFVAIKNTDDIYYFEDDFSGNGEGEPLDYWAKGPFSKATASWSANDGRMSISGDGTYLLDATTDETKFNATLNVKTKTTGVLFWTSTNTEVYITARYRNESENVKAIYSFKDKKWYLKSYKGIETVNNVKKQKETQLATSTNGKLSDSTNAQISLTIKDDKLTLISDGTTVFSNVELDLLGHGKIGIGSSSAEVVYVDDVTYEGAGKVNIGAAYTWFRTKDPETGISVGNTVEFFKDSTGAIRAASSGMSKPDPNDSSKNVFTSFRTNDNGNTWQNVPDDTTYYNNAITLRSGKFLLVNEWGGRAHATLYESVNGTGICSSNIQKTADYGDCIALNGRLEQGTTVYPGATEPRVFFITSAGSEENGEVFMYYSDDEGKTWTSMSTVMNYESLGKHNVNEADIVELPDGTIRIYFRNDRGFLYYSDSKDGGNTFDIPLTATQFMTPSTAFAVGRDPQNTNNYYMLWEYDVSNAATNYIQQPRNRQGLAVSYDGCKTWQYIMEMDDRGVYPSTSHCNANVRVFDGVLYASFAYLWDIDYATDISVNTMIVTVDLDKLKGKTLMRFTEPHKTVPDYVDLYDIADNQCVLPKTTGDAMIYGQVVPVEVKDGLVEAEVVAQAFSAHLAISGNTATLSIGDGSVVFTDGVSGYSINGTWIEGLEIGYVDGYMNVSVCAEIFNKVLTETDNSYVITRSEISDLYISGLENITAGVSAEINSCIIDFKSISDASDMEAFFAKYEVLLNLDTSFGYQSYVNVYNAYTKLELSEITDYESLVAAINSISEAEKIKIDSFIEAMNLASENNDYAVIKELLTLTYNNLLSITIDTSKVENPDEVYRKMLGITYYSVADVENAFKAALAAQIHKESGLDDSIITSTASQGFDAWSYAGTDDLGGAAAFEENGENIVSFSTHAGTEKVFKSAVQPKLENGLVYSESGSLNGTIGKSGSVTVDKTAGLVTFAGTGAFKLTGSGKAKSNTMITVFDMTKPTGTVTATFKDGFHSAEITFNAEGTDVGKLPEYLEDEECISYRIEKSLSKVTVLAKAQSAPETDYCILGSKSVSTSASNFWYAMFSANNANLVISNLGVYSALSGVRYDTSGYTLLDNLHYTANDANGADMAALRALNSGSNMSSVDATTGNLILEHTGENVWFGVSTTSGGLTGAFDRAEMEITVSETMAGYMAMYFADNSDWRYANTNLRLDPNTVNGKATNYANYSSNTVGSDKFYTIRFVTQMVDYHKSQTSGHNHHQTVASMYIKAPGESQWVCLAHEELLELGGVFNYPGRTEITIGNLKQGNRIEIKEFSLKTYKRDEGTYSFSNLVDMPEADYMFRFNYMNLRDDVSTVLEIGGGNYGQTLKIEKGQVGAIDTIPTYKDVNIAEDQWYEFVGKVTMTPEGTVSQYPGMVTKNKMTLYMYDSNGNQTVIFKDLPMLKDSCINGLLFKMEETANAAVLLKNIRVYSGKAVDVISRSIADGKASVTVDILNDDADVDSVVVPAGVYTDGKMTGLYSPETGISVDALGVKRHTVSDVGYNVINGKNPEMKLFFWKDTKSMQSLIKPIVVR